MASRVVPNGLEKSIFITLIILSILMEKRIQHSIVLPVYTY